MGYYLKGINPNGEPIPDEPYWLDDSEYSEEQKKHIMHGRIILREHTLQMMYGIGDHCGILYAKYVMIY